MEQFGGVFEVSGATRRLAARGRLLGEYRIGQDDAAGRRRFAEAMEERRQRDEPGEWKAVRQGWFLGGGELKARLLEQMEGTAGPHHGGGEKQETDEQKAERIVVEELKARAWGKLDLPRRRNTDAGKVAIARGCGGRQ